MDKLRIYLGILRKHHFWVLCGIAALIGLISWQISSGKLAAEFDNRVKAIGGKITTLQGIQSTPDSPHPNEECTKGIQAATKVDSDAITQIWNALYTDVKAKVYVWPAALGADFIRQAERLEDPQATLGRDLLVRYQEIVKSQAQKLAEIVDAPPPDELAAGGNALGGFARMFGGELAQPMKEYTVQWPGLAETIQMFEWDVRPTTLEVKHAQEELWVLAALCNVIKNVNQGSTGAHDAGVKAINQMAIAYAAADDPTAGSQLSRIERNIVASVPGAAPAAPEPAAGDPAAGKPPRPDAKSRGKSKSGEFGRLDGGIVGMPIPGADAAGGVVPTSPDDFWKSWRYVKATGEPLMAAEVDSQVPEYNLMPFRLHLAIEPSALDRILLELRNSVLPMEVREVRVNPTTASSYGGGFRGSRSSFSEGSDYSSAGSSGAQGTTMPVEISGVIYLIKSPKFRSAAAAPATMPTDGAGAVGG